MISYFSFCNQNTKSLRVQFIYKFIVIYLNDYLYMTKEVIEFMIIVNRLMGIWNRIYKGLK